MLSGIEAAQEAVSESKKEGFFISLPLFPFYCFSPFSFFLVFLLFIYFFFLFFHHTMVRV